MEGVTALGIDFRLREISMALRGPDTLRVVTKYVSPGVGLDAALRALGVSTTTLVEYLAKDVDVACAIVEQPMGVKSIPKELYMAEGVIFERLNLFGVAAFDVNPATWRKEILGHGNLRTEEAKGAALEYAKALGYEGDKHDEAEAICLAEYGCRTVKIG